MLISYQFTVIFKSEGKHIFSQSQPHITLMQADGHYQTPMEPPIFAFSVAIGKSVGRNFAVPTYSWFHSSKSKL